MEIHVQNQAFDSIFDSFYASPNHIQGVIGNRKTDKAYLKGSEGDQATYKC